MTDKGNSILIFYLVFVIFLYFSRFVGIRGYRNPHFRPPFSHFQGGSLWLVSFQVLTVLDVFFVLLRTLVGMFIPDIRGGNLVECLPIFKKVLYSLTLPKRQNVKTLDRLNKNSFKCSKKTVFGNLLILTNTILHQW